MEQRSTLRDVEHLIRPLVVAAVLLVAFLGVRAMLVPDDFGKYGYFRAGALDDVRAQQPRFAGREACADCHDDVVAARSGQPHERVGCEACHGALAAHASDPTETVPEPPDPAGLCLRCHGYSAYRPADFPQVVAEDHAMDETCDACHDPHAPRIE
jgi:hypothetical protein